MPVEARGTGGANTKFYDSPEVISQFDGVKTWLMKNFKKVFGILSYNLFRTSNYNIVNFWLFILIVVCPDGPTHQQKFSHFSYSAVAVPGGSFWEE